MRVERAAPFRGVHAGGARGKQTRLMPPPRWAARGFGVLMEGASASQGPGQPSPPPSSPVPLEVPRASPTPQSPPAPAAEELFSDELKLCAKQPESRQKPLLERWPPGLGHSGSRPQAGAPRESQAAGGELVATERRARTALVGGGRAGGCVAFLRPPLFHGALV